MTSSANMEAFEARQKEPGYDYYNDPHNPWWTPETDIIKANQRIGHLAERVGEQYRAISKVVTALLLTRAFLFYLVSRQYVPAGDVTPAVLSLLDQLDENGKQLVQSSTPSPDPIVGKLCVIPIGVNAEGQGPEMDPTKVVRTEYHIWDETNRLVAVSDRHEFVGPLVLAYNDSLTRSSP